MGSSSLVIRPIEPTDVAATALVWHESKQAAYGFLPLEMAMTPEQDEAFFRERVLPGLETWVAVTDGDVMGFLTLNGSFIERLYVHPKSQATGVGSALLDHAKQCSPHGLELFTHQKNTQARQFYERRGFTVARFGTSPPPENEPDLEYHWRPESPPSATTMT